MTRRDFSLALALPLLSGAGRTAAAFGAPAAPADTSAASAYRPQIHYSPPTGFMNDPNGLLFHEGEYHLFYQYNPFAPKAGNVHWGHAVSSDGLRWQTLPIALKETKAGQAFSGSAVFDKQNTSGLFGDGQNNGGLVAVYTRASDTKQAQEIAFSLNKGRTFTEYASNPVLDVQSDSFRDPKVFWHKESNRWILAAVRSRQHRVVFYGSPDLKNWTELSDFGHAGILGVDYECPDLVRVPVETSGKITGHKWVLFVSINPGAPLGGSGVQYFVGEWDGARFAPDDAATRFMDFAKDFYAVQSFGDVPGDAPLALAWMSNWQYCNDLPTGNWRGVMSLPRRLSLRRKADDWVLTQTPLSLDALADKTLPIAVPKNASAGGVQRTVGVPSGAAWEARLKMTVAPDSVTTIRLSNKGGETLDVGYDAGAAAQLFIDRGNCKGFSHRFFTDKFAVAIAPNTRELDLHLIVDRCTLEVFAQNGEAVGSALYFPRKPLTGLSILGTQPIAFGETIVRTLKPSVPSG